MAVALKRSLGVCLHGGSIRCCLLCSVTLLWGGSSPLFVIYIINFNMSDYKLWNEQVTALRKIN